MGEIGPKIATIPGPVPPSTPKPFIKPFLGGLYAGLSIQFETIPALQFSLQKIDFDLFLNGHVVANCTIEQLEFKDIKDATIMIKIVPLSTYRPITGSISIAKGFMKGAINGVANGLLFGDWGNKSMVIQFLNRCWESETYRFDQRARNFGGWTKLRQTLKLSTI